MNIAQQQYKRRFLMNEPFSIALRLHTPFVSSPLHPPTLDALLAAARFNQTGDIQEMLDIPLSCTDGVFHGSCPSILEPMGSALRATTRIFISTLRATDLSLPNVQFPSEIDPKRGTYQSQMTKHTAYSVPGGGGTSATLVFYGRGDPEHVHQLLSEFLLGVGKCAARGMGEIAQIGDPVDLNEDLSLKIGDQPMRPIPLATWIRMGGPGDVNQGFAAWRPPYYAAAKDLCALPSVLLRDVRKRVGVAV